MKWHFRKLEPPLPRFTEQITAQTLGVMAFVSEQPYRDNENVTGFTAIRTACPYGDDDPLAEHWARGYEQAGEAFR